MNAATISVRKAKPSHRAVGIWLLAVAAIIIGMLAVGGLTRLTGSGLSITQWQPIMGAIPPMSHTAWQDAFEKYQQIPQYRLENEGMTLAGFKAIFWWEWSHRLLGRLIGVLFLVPFLWFAWTGAIARKDWPRMLLLFALGGLQGFIGWWMVESGLETRVAVAPYRLAIHLGTAVILLGAILWIALEYLRSPSPGARSAPASSTRGEAKWAFGFVGLVYIQMLLGALVAGLHAGLIYNTWPSMDGRVFPEHPFFYAPWWYNFVHNAGLAQFDHRLGAYLVTAAAIALWWRSRALSSLTGNALLAITVIQVALGITTLLLQAPIALSAIHQVTAALLFCTAVWHAFEIRSRYASASP
ncbi:MAG: COX15/CtaA family protein [Alphaproteobacteria bacterium]|nr:COX15/CtaA family protein [Alphaproteobacteria bacterium]